MTDLRIGVVGFDDRLYLWQANVVSRIRALPGAVIAAYLGCRHTPETGYRAPRRSRAFAIVADGLDASLRPLTEFADWDDLDLIINLTRASVRPAEAHGLWQLHFAEPDHPGRAETRHGDPVSHVYLRQDSIEGGRTLGHFCFKTAANHRRNCDRLMLAGDLIFERAIRGVLAGVAPPPPSALPRIPAHPTGLQRLARRLRRMIEKSLYRTRWTIGLAPRGIGEIFGQQTLPEIRWLTDLPPARFFADPFPLSVDNDSITVLAENGDMAPPYKGHISALTIKKDGRVARIGDAIVKAEHLSFPFVFAESGHVVCLPECHQSGALRAFRQEGQSWLPDVTLLDGVAAVDPVMLHHSGRWWLFCCDRAQEDTTHLYLYFSDSWRGPWIAHPLNPVKSDVRSSRPAGAVVNIDGTLYRPAQDCSERYGGTISVQRITELSESAFREETAFVLEPRALGPGFVGVHTINGLGDVTLIDGLQRRFRLFPWVHALLPVWPGRAGKRTASPTHNVR